MTTHENFLSNSETCKRIMQLPADTHLRNLVSVPLFHVTGCNSQLIITTQLNGTTVVMPAFDVQAFLAGDRRRADQHPHVGPGDLLAGDEPAELPRDRREQRPLGHLRRRTDGARRGRQAALVVPERPARATASG